MLFQNLLLTNFFLKGHRISIEHISLSIRTQKVTFRIELDKVKKINSIIYVNSFKLEPFLQHLLSGYLGAGQAF